MAQPTHPIEDILAKAIHTVVENIITKTVEAARAEVERKVRAETAAITATVFRTFSVERYSQDEVKITVNFKNTRASSELPHS